MASTQPVKPLKSLPPFLAHVGHAVNPIIDIVNRGLIVSSSTVIAERLSDGRIKLRLRPGAVGIVGPITPNVINAVYITGTGYTAGDILTAVGGTFTVPFSLILDSVDGTGAATGWHWRAGYVYTVEPTNSVSFSGGTGTGAQFDLTWEP